MLTAHPACAAHSMATAVLEPPTAVRLVAAAVTPTAHPACAAPNMVTAVLGLTTARAVAQRLLVAAVVASLALLEPCIKEMALLGQMRALGQALIPYGASILE